MTTTPSNTGHVKTRLPKLRFLPAVDQWPRAFHAPTSETQIQARAQLGLPTDVPIIASGHQPIVFHPGIISKLIALDHLAQESGAHPVWIVPDQDVVDPALIRQPNGSRKELSVSEIRLGGSPIGQTPSALSGPLQIDPDLPAVLESLGSWISGYEHEDTLARQFSSAIIAMLSERLGIREPTILYASDLMKTVGDSLLESILDNPKSAIQAYNAAVEKHPNAGVRPLRIKQDRIELPFWRLVTDSRSEVFVDPTGKAGFDRSGLAPRGLTMTAIMRSLLCELFIHGTGGYDYDQITTEWIKNWCNQPLAPIVGITADIYLDLDLPELPSTAGAIWKAHHAKHDPSMLGDESASESKAQLVQAIRDSKARGDRSESAKLFAQLQKLLVHTRREHAEELARLDQAVDDARSLERISEIAQERSWAFPLYTDQQLESLKALVVDALGSAD